MLRIVSKPGSKRSVIIYLDESARGVLPQSLALSLTGHIREGDIPAETAERILAEIRKNAWHKLLDYLALRERTTRECKQYLRRWLIPSSVAEELITLAEEKGYISHKRYAELLARSMADRGRSRMECKMKLRQAGIDPQLIETVMNEVFPPDVERDILADLVEKALTKYRDKPRHERYHKCLEFLVRKGFSYESSKSALYQYARLEEPEEWG